MVNSNVDFGEREREREREREGGGFWREHGHFIMLTEQLTI